MKLHTTISSLAALLLACGGAQEPAATTQSQAAANAATTADVKPIPEGMHSVNVHLVVRGLDEAIDFYEKALGATKRYTLTDPAGKTMHAEMKIGDSVFMLAEENEQWGMKSPKTLGGSPVHLQLYLPDADAAFASAVAAGATPVLPIGDMFWGDRYGMVIDPFGHQWAVASRIANVTPEQMEAGMKAAMAGQPVAVERTPGIAPVPEGYLTLTPSLIVSDAAKAIDFYVNTLGFAEQTRTLAPDGSILHAELTFGDGKIFISDPMMGAKSVQQLGGTPVNIMLYVPDVDAAFAKATGGGAKAAEPVTKQFWGDRYGKVVDPFGQEWGMGTHVEDVPPEEIQQRMNEMMKSVDKNTQG